MQDVGLIGNRRRRNQVVVGSGCVGREAAAAVIDQRDRVESAIEAALVLHRDGRVDQGIDRARQESAQSFAGADARPGPRPQDARHAAR